MNQSAIKIDEINKQLIKFDEIIIQGGKLKEISLKFYKIKKEFSLIETRIVQKSLNDTISNELQEQINKTEKNIEIIEKYIQLKNGTKKDGVGIHMEEKFTEPHQKLEQIMHSFNT